MVVFYPSLLLIIIYEWMLEPHMNRSMSGCWNHIWTEDAYATNLVYNHSILLRKEFLADSNCSHPLAGQFIHTKLSNNANYILLKQFNAQKQFKSWDTQASSFTLVKNATRMSNKRSSNSCVKWTTSIVLWIKLDFFPNKVKLELNRSATFKQIKKLQ
jgi:hypothetical protein